MKKKIITTTFVILFVIILCVAVALWFNHNFNVSKLKSVENNALEYIHQTYPDFIVSDISVRHECDWESNHYVVDYDDGKGDSRTVIFDHTGEELLVDEYIDSKAFNIVYAYESGIEQKVNDILKNISGEYSIHYVYIDDEKAYGKEREIALEGLDISKDFVECTIGLTREEIPTIQEFANISKEIIIVLSLEQLPLEKVEVILYSQGNRFYLNCPSNMGEMSIDEISDLVEK